jgi:hypothetical protein
LLAGSERRGDALIDGDRRVMRGQMIWLDRRERQSFVVLSECKREVGDSGGGAMLDCEDDALIAVTPEIEVGIAPGVELGGAT